MGERTHIQSLGTLDLRLRAFDLRLTFPGSDLLDGVTNVVHRKDRYIPSSIARVVDVPLDAVAGNPFHQAFLGEVLSVAGKAIDVCNEFCMHFDNVRSPASVGNAVEEMDASVLKLVHAKFGVGTNHFCGAVSGR